MASDVLVVYVNGNRHEVKNPSPDRTLLEFLREDLVLTGTKNSCLEGACNACTVTVSQWDRQEGRARHSAVTACLTSLCSLHGKSVTTVEGLGSVGVGLHPVQERIYKAHGSQCGFCTPGMVMSMSSLLREEESIQERDVSLALQGNLCRCTGYRAILEGFRTFCNGDVSSSNGDATADRTPLFDLKSFKPYDKTSDPAFPEELKCDKLSQSLHFTSGDSQHWYVPVSVDEVSKIVENHKAVEFIAGGTGHFKKPLMKTSPVKIQLGNINELHQVEQREGGMYYGSAITMKRLQKLCRDAAKNMPDDHVGAFKLLSDVLTSWVCAQVRNVATIGGHIGWAHPCSDLIPILMATGCSLEVLDLSSRVKRVVAIDKDLFDAPYDNTLKSKDLILGLIVPFSKSGERGFFYRRARRKEFDLAIANACFFATVADGKAKNVRIAVGGMEAAFPEARASSPSLAKNTMQYIRGMSLEALDKQALAKEVFKDVFVEERSPGQFSNYRRCLVAVFVERFLSDIKGTGQQPSKFELPGRGKCVYEVAEKDQPDHDTIERPVPHNWAAEQAAGEATYIDDMHKFKDELKVIPIHSDRPHAKITDIDFSEALKIEGVLGTLVPDDLKFNAWGVRPAWYDEEILAREPKYTGQIIAALVCNDSAQGRKARSLVKVTYEVLPHVFDMDDLAGKPSSDCTIGPKIEVKRESDLKPEGSTVTVKGTVKCGGQEHLYLETHRALAVPGTEKDEMTVHASNQDPQVLQKCIGMVLNVPRHKITIKTKRAGGGFGGKERPQICLLAAVAARKFRRSARISLRTSEDFQVCGHRQNTVMDYEITTDKMGRVTKFLFDGKFNAGISIEQTAYVAGKCLTSLDGGYTWKDFEGTAHLMATNVSSTTAMRGFGTPEGCLLAEMVMDHVAHELKMDVMDVKRANMTKEGDLLHYFEQTAVGCATIKECWDEVIKKGNYHMKRAEVDAFNKVNKVMKRGLTVMPMKFAISRPGPGKMQANAYVRIFTDGTVLLNHGGVEMGQGLNTKMIQVCSRALGVSISKIHIEDTNTSSIVNGTGTGASVGSDLNGPAVMDACEQLNKRLAPIKEKYPDGTWEHWVNKAYLALINLSAVGHYSNPEVTAFDFKTGKGVRTNYFTNAAGCLEVEVDCHTGDITVLSADIVFDLGRSLNPAIDITQIEGAFLQGLGWATTEQLLMSPKTGELLTTSPSTYKVPTLADVPKVLNVTLLKHKEGRAASACYSSKGIGEPPLVLAMGLASAVREAVASYRSDHGNDEWFHLDIPMMVDKVRMACTDDYTRAAQEIETKVDKKDKLAFET